MLIVRSGTYVNVHFWPTGRPFSFHVYRDDTLTIGVTGAVLWMRFDVWFNRKRWYDLRATDSPAQHAKPRTFRRLSSCSRAPARSRARRNSQCGDARGAGFGFGPVLGGL